MFLKRNVTLSHVICPKCSSSNGIYNKKTETWKCIRCRTIFKTTGDIWYENIPVCIICGQPTKHFHHLNLDRSDNRDVNLVPVCKYHHGLYHGLMNGNIGDVATERDIMSALVDKGLTAEEILYALLGVSCWLSKVKGSELREVLKKEMQNLQTRIGCEGRSLEKTGFGVQEYI